MFDFNYMPKIYKHKKPAKQMTDFNIILTLIIN